MASNESSDVLPEPRLKLLPRDPGRVYCDICDNNWSNKTHKKKKQVFVADKEKVKARAKQWNQYDHEYSKVFNKVDWSQPSITQCDSCRRQFHSDSFMGSQEKQVEESTSTVTSPITTPTLVAASDAVPARYSSRKRCSYDTKRDVEEEKKCIICKTTKKDGKGRNIPVTLITLRDAKDNDHVAEKTLLEFAKIHVKHNTIYKEAAERILLVKTTKSLFNADVGYHKEQCYASFRHRKYLLMDNPTILDTTPDTPAKDSLLLLCELVQLHVICRQEVYALSDLRHAYDALRTSNCPILKVGEIKSRLLQEFPNEISINTSAHSKNKQEYVFPASSSLTPDFLEAAADGFGLSKTAVFRSAARRLHHALSKKQVKRKWPPTPQDILEDKDPFDADTYNFLAWIVDPHAPIGENGLAKLQSMRKAKKIGEMCRNIESLLPGGQPSMDQVLFSLRLHWKTATREPVDIASAFGYGITYTETLFIEDIWADWDRRQNSNIPSNIRKKTPTTVVADNIDWKNKDISGRETHNTNIILIQHQHHSLNEEGSKEEGSKVFLEPNYNFERKKHRSFKSNETNTETSFPCRKVNPEKFTIEGCVSPVAIEYVQASRKTIAWMLCRRGNDTGNLVPGWSAFQSLTSNKPKLCEVNVGYHPAIHDTPTKYETILKVLKITDEIMKELELGHIFLEVDQAIYTKILDAKFYLLHTAADNAFKNVIVRMGGFHVILCLMRSIYSRYRGYGFIELLAQVGTLGGPGTIEKGLNGGDVKAGVRLYKLLFEALYRIKFRYLEEVAIIPEDENISSFLTQIQEARGKLSFEMIQKLINSPQIQYYQSFVEGDMAHWIDSFLEMVDLLLNIIHFQRTGNWNGFLECVYKFLPYCFSLNRKNYARNLSYYYMNMLDLKRRNKEAYQYLENGGFTGSLTGSSHSNIPCDQVIETTINRYSKSTGGITGKTEDKDASERWVRLNPYMCALKEHMDSKIKKKRNGVHIEIGSKRKKKDETDVALIVETLNAWVPDLYCKDKQLTNISNGIQASEELVNNSRSVTNRGVTERDAFFSRISTADDLDGSGDLKYNDPIKKQPLVTFAAKKTKENTFSIPEDEGLSFGDILARYDQKFLDLSFLCMFPIYSRPWAICNEREKAGLNSKSLFRNGLQKLSPVAAVGEQEAPIIHTFVVDAMKVVRMVGVAKLQPPTFLSWTKRFLNNIMSLKAEVIHIVFDRYSLEVDLTRPSKGRGKTSERKYVSSLTQIIPLTKSDWQSFLSNDANKYQLVKLVTDYILSNEFIVHCPIYVTKDEKCFRK